MELIRDDPIVAHILRTGYPPWADDEEPGEEDADVFFGNETESF